MYDKTNDSSLIRQPAFYVMFKNQNKMQRIQKKIHFKNGLMGKNEMPKIFSNPKINQN